MSTIHLIIDIYSHNFVCRAITPRAMSICNEYAKKFVQWGIKHERGRYLKQPMRVFASKTKDSFEYRFHINVYKEFLEHLKFHQLDINTSVDIKTVPKCNTDNIEMKVKSIFQPRENQIAAIDYLCADNNNKLVSAQTGAGKGAMTLFSIERLSKITAIIVRPQFLLKWRDEILEKCDVTEDEIMVVQGTPQLLKLLELGKYNKLNCKFILISNKTMQVWFKKYEELREDILDLGYECLPHEMYQLLNVGIRVVDEVHMDLHLQCKIDLYSHVEHAISLSATLLSDDPFIRKMQEMLYPLKDRYDSGGLDKFIDSYGVIYSLENTNGIRTSEFGSANYSHMAYEKSLLKYRPRLMKYLNMIDWLINDTYFKVKRPNKKLLVYASSIMMCTVMANYFKSKYSHLDIRRYCEDDPYENLLEPDIRFSTVLSAGVGHDIPDLTNTIMTNAMSSIQSNIQALGRLRKLSDGHPVEFYFLSCKDIPKHMEYHKAKEELLNKRAKSYKKIECGFVV